MFSCYIDLFYTFFQDSNYYNKIPAINRANKPRLEEKIRQFSGVKGNVVSIHNIVLLLSIY